MRPVRTESRTPLLWYNKTKPTPPRQGGAFLVYNLVELWYNILMPEGGSGCSPTSRRGEVAGMTAMEVYALLTLIATVVFGVLNLTLKK